MAKNQPDKDLKLFIAALKKAMDERPELSLNEVARRADISPTYLSLLQNGQRRIPSNAAIAGLERALSLSRGELSKFAKRPDDEALAFFRKEQAAPIMKTLAKVPEKELGKLHKMIQKFIGKQK